MKMDQGICVFPGLAMAKPIWVSFEIKSLEHKNFLGVEQEISAFKTALAKTEKQISEIKAITLKKLGAAQAEIFEAHLMMLQDPEYVEGIESEIQNKQTAVAAITKTTESFIAVLGAASSEYMRERVSDLKDISQRLLRNLANAEGDIFDSLTEPVILLADDLTPSDLLMASNHQISGVGLAKGGMTSHTAILLKSMGIPAVFGLKNLAQFAAQKKSSSALLNAKAGTLVLDADEKTLKDFSLQIESETRNKEELKIWKEKKTILADQKTIPLCANVGNQNQLEAALKNGAEGVGLYRTEFLFMDRATAPKEDEQFEIYKKALTSLNGKTLTIRTLDIGGDKKIPYLKLALEENPFLGVRGLRLCLKHPEIFQTQIRALIRASDFGPLEIMFPMVTATEELEQAFALINPLLATKKTESFPIKWGMMLEVPSNLFMIREFSKLISFFSVGTNDLIQYLTACDRMNPDLASISDAYSPGVLRALHHLGRDVNQNGRDLSVCGEVASDPLLVPFLVGIGVHKLSLNSLLIAHNRRLMAGLNVNDCQKLAEEVIQLSSRVEIKKALEAFQA